MIVPISASSGSAVAEWALVELQGKLEGLTEAQVLGHVGTLMIAPNAEKDTVQLTIGYHQMEGKWIPLKKPFAILQSIDSSAEITENREALDANDADKVPVKAPQSSITAAYSVVGVIRFKLLFKARPRALISKPQK